MQPNTDVFNTELQPVLVGSLQDNLGSGDGLHDGGEDNTSPTNPDNDNRSRRSYNRWDDEEDEDYDY